jgi:hypothetical protein
MAVGLLVAKEDEYSEDDETIRDTPFFMIASDVLSLRGVEYLGKGENEEDVLEAFELLLTVSSSSSLSSTSFSAFSYGS